MATKQRKVGLAVGGVLVATGLTLVLLKSLAKAAPELVLSDLTIHPDVAYVGEPVDISVLATNVGDVYLEYKVTCEVL